ncbi:MAG: Gfo/Idh/MocA family protein [Planctomycetota bacterium]|jgi:predicted dehydrogenase
MVARFTTVTLGIIGAGGAATQHAEAAARAGLPLAVVCDADLERARALAAEHSPAQATASADELLADPAIAGVIVATPNFLHKELAVAALRAGKDVLLEKPMAMNVDECDEIIAARQQSGQLLQLGFVCRCAAATMAVREMLEAGRLGRVYHVKASIYRCRGIPGLGRWFTTRARSGGGVLMDLGVHLIDLVLHLTGYRAPARASAVCTSTFGSPIDRYAYEEMWGGPPDPQGVSDVEDAATALVRFDNGMSMELNAVWAADLSEERMRNQIVLFGDRGGCWMALWHNELTLPTERDGSVVDEPVELANCDAWAAAWTGQAETFARNVAGRTPPEASAENGRAVQSLVEALYRSAAEGREVDV